MLFETDPVFAWTALFALAIVFVGVIYNYISARNELKRHRRYAQEMVELMDRMYSTPHERGRSPMRRL